MTAVLLDGQPIPHRLLNEHEQAKLDESRAAWERTHAEYEAAGKKPPFKLNTKRQFHVVVLVCPEPGNNLTYRDMPEGYDEFHIRWHDPNGSTFHMRIDGEDAGEP
jgi:hypothetical protein